jgi:hypothetical protein
VTSGSAQLSARRTLGLVAEVREAGRLAAMKALQALVFGLWLLLTGLTVHAVQSLGSAGGMVFFSDFSHPWRAQFNTDFSIHLLLFIIWVVWRESSKAVGIACGVLCLLGGLTTPVYLLVAIYRANGDPKQLLLGVHANA